MRWGKYKLIYYVICRVFIIFISVQSIIGCTTLTMTPLIKASKDGDVSQIRLLLNQGVDVNERTKGKYPTAAIHWASYSGSIEAVTLLLGSGVNVNTSDYCDQTPIIWAANGTYSHKSKMVSFLISKGADVEIVDCHGWTVFNYADNSEDKALIEMLAERRTKLGKKGIDDPDFQPYKPTIDYKNISIDLRYQGNEQIALSVHDKRPYIVSGEKKQDYVGYFRKANFGQPYDATTPNNNPLSDTLSLGITESFIKVGFNVNAVKAMPLETNQDLIEKMKQFQVNKLVVLTIREWLSEAYYNVGLTYDVSLSIMDKNGTTIAVSNIKGSDDLGGGGSVIPEMRAKIYVPAAAKKKLEELFNKQEIIKALTTK